MKKILVSVAFLLLFGTAVFAQKGVDTQTQTIKEETNKVTSRPNDVSRSINWGKDKTKVPEPLPNPYRLNSRRDVLLSTIEDALREKKIVVDEASSRLKDGLLVTQPYIFAKGSIIAQNELNRYAILEPTDTTFTKAQYTLTIEIQPIDGIRNNVSVIAKIEGRAGNGLSAEWVTLRSSGLAENEFLAKLIELVTGESPYPVKDSSH